MRPRHSRRTRAMSTALAAFACAVIAACSVACSEGGTGTGTAPPPSPGCPKVIPVAGTECRVLEVCVYDNSNKVAFCPGGKSDAGLPKWDVQERGDALVYDVSQIDTAGDATDEAGDGATDDAPTDDAQTDDDALDAPVLDDAAPDALDAG